MALSQILATLELINPLLESIRLKESESESESESEDKDELMRGWLIKAEQLAVIARHTLEIDAVAAEADVEADAEADDSSVHQEQKQVKSKELRFLQAIERNLAHLSMKFDDLVINSIDLKDVDMLEMLMEDERFEKIDDEFAAIRFLHPALTGGNLEISRLLLNYKKKDLVTALRKEEDILQVIIDEGLIVIFEMLLKDGRVPPLWRHLRYIIDHRMHSPPAPFVKLLLEDGRVDPGSSNDYAIIEAVKLGKESIVRELLRDSRVNPKAVFNTPLLSAISRGDGNATIVKLLVDSGRVLLGPTILNNVGPTILNNDDPLEYAKKCGHIRLVEILKEAYANKGRMDSQLSHLVHS